MSCQSKNRSSLSSLRISAKKYPKASAFWKCYNISTIYHDETPSQCNKLRKENMNFRRKSDFIYNNYMHLENQESTNKLKFNKMVTW